MAQVLKEEMRQAILKAAKRQFYLHGLESASLRKIAKEAGTSPGNVYRYFKNKEALAQEILADTLKKLDLVTEQHLLIPEEGASLNFFQQQLGLFADQLVEVFIEDQQELIILIYHSRYAQQLILWFGKTLLQLVNHWFPMLESDRRVELLCNMLAESIVAGLTRGFKESVNTMAPEEIRWTIGTYLHLYTLMLSAGGEHYEQT